MRRGTATILRTHLKRMVAVPFGHDPFFGVLHLHHGLLRQQPVNSGRIAVADNQDDEMTVVPIPASETQDEHDRIRESNDRDQQLEREGKVAPHNRGYDEVAEGGVHRPAIERVVDE